VKVVRGLKRIQKVLKFIKFQKKACLEGFKWQGKMVSGPLTAVSVISESRTPEARR